MTEPDPVEKLLAGITMRETITDGLYGLGLFLIGVGFGTHHAVDRFYQTFCLGTTETTACSGLETMLGSMITIGLFAGGVMLVAGIGLDAYWENDTS